MAAKLVSLAFIYAIFVSNNPVARAAPGGSYGHPPGQHRPQGSCNTGSIQCCNQHIRRSSPSFLSLPSRLLAAGGSPSLIGLVSSLDEVHSGCSPLSGPVGGLLGALGLGLGGGAQCNNQPVCCSQSEFNGLVSIGCSPININIL
ncbi:fungal hydrophobin-domain-containing protein [Panaeolus papilionaceus]|nr:fungal hydrophobin-domain-containing protein [Panaeolus papilionaceus]